MRRRIAVVAVACVGLVGMLATTGAVHAADAKLDKAERGFAIETPAPGVYALVRTKPAGMLLDANLMFVVADDGVVVVDAGLTPSSAERAIAALRGITQAPVKFLIDTHRHADHTGANATWRAAYPGVAIVGQEQMRADLAAAGQATLDGWIDWAKQLATDLPRALESGKSLGGKPLDAELRGSYEADLAAARELVADAGRMKLELPDLTIGERLTLTFGGRTIDVRAPGKGHTRGDLVVWLPAERILATGDLMTAPVPLVGADQSYPEEWVGTLDSLLALEPKTIVPGHGAIEHDLAPMRLYRDFLAAVVAQTKAAMARGESAEQATAGLDVESFRRKMAGESRVLDFLFANWGTGPTVAALYRVRDEQQATAQAAP